MMLAIGAVILVIVAGGGYYAWKTYFSQTPTETPAPEAPVVEDTTYASSTMRFSLKYPQGFTLQEPYAYTRVSPTKPINSVKFTVPAAMVQWTNLAPDSGVSVEELPRAKTCTGDIYLLANVRAQSLTEGATTYSFASSTDTKGSDMYEEMVYAIPSSSPCIAMRYFLHSTIGTMATGTSAFDRAALLADFDKIRQSLVLQ